MANFCSNCGKSLRESARFCPYCGTKVFNVTLNNSTQNSGASSYEKDKIENGDKESTSSIATRRVMSQNMTENEKNRKIKEKFATALDRAELGGIISGIGLPGGDLIAAVDEMTDHGADANKVKDLIEIAEEGDAGAMRILGQLYMNGVIVKANGERALYWTKRAAEAGDDYAVYFLGHIYYHNGLKEEGIQWFAKSAESMSKYSCVSAYSIGQHYYDIKEYDKAMDWFIKSYNAGKDASEERAGTSAYFISRMFEEGFGVPKDKNQAKLWKKRSKEADKFCFITTATCNSLNKSDDCYELTMFRNFRDTWLLHQDNGSSLIKGYYEIAPLIVDKINQLPNSREIYQSIWDEWLSTCLELIEQGRNENCKLRYIDMVKHLKKTFLDK